MISVIGEVLFDMFPDYSRLGGAPLNFAAHCRRFGNGVRFCSRVGSDTEGALVRDALRGLGLDDALVQTDPDFPTGRVFVKLDAQGVPEFDIARDMAYDMLRLDDAVSGLLRGNCRLLYTGTLVQRSEEAFMQVQKLLSECHAGCEIFYDINLRPGCYTSEIIESTLYRATILKLNDGELDDIRHLCALPAGREEAVAAIRERYNIDRVCLTLGAQGAVLYTPAGRFQAAAHPVRTLKDTVGAGDGFAAVLAVGLLSHWPEEVILRRAARFAALICETEGALPSSTDIYRKLIEMEDKDG